MNPNGGVNPTNAPVDPTNPQQMAPPAPTAPTLEAAPGPVQLPPDNINGDPALTVPPVSENKGILKKVLLVMLALVVLFGLSGGAYFVGFTTGKAKGRTEADAEYQRKQAQAQQEEAEEETKDEEAALQLGDLRVPKYEDETVEGETGKQVSAGDGLVLKVVNIERNFKPTDANYKLDTSKELVKVNFLIGNVANDKPKDISSFSFRLEDSSGALLTPENIAEYSDKFDTVKIDQGAQAKASIVYKVNKDEVPLKFVREQRYRITTENREVTTKIVISVAK